MKKKCLILVLAVIASVLAVALCGCKSKPVADNGDYYVICDDGNGRTYRFDDGNELVAFYQYDPDLTLTFTFTYYSKQTNEVNRSYALDEVSCNFPQVRKYDFTVRNGGVEKACLKVIISAQAVSAQLAEGRALVRHVAEDAGETYSFKPQITGNYTISCMVDEGSPDTVDYILTDINGVPVDGKLQQGWIYYLHVCVTKNNMFFANVTVSTTVTFTPPEIKFGDNNVNLEYNGNIFAFTPEEHGVYSFTDDTDFLGGAYEILDGETYERITDSQWENEAVLYAGNRYYINSQVGYETPTTAVLTVKRIDSGATDRRLSPDTEAELEWYEFYTISVDKHANYHFELQSDTTAGATAFYIYDVDLSSVNRRFDFVENYELDTVLEAGTYIIRTTDDCKLTYSFAPQTIGEEKLYARVKAGEWISFKPPISCAYTYATDNSSNVTITDTDGNAADGVLSASAEYYIHCDADDWVTAKPITETIKIHNAEIEAGDGKAVSFKPIVGGKYAIFGATEIKILEARNLTAVDITDETYGYSVWLKDGTDYIAVVKAGTLTYGNSVITKFYPAAIANDLTTQTKIGNGGAYRRIELPVGGNVTVAKRTNYGEVKMTLIDAEFQEIATAVNTVSVQNLQAGTYYVKCTFSQGPQTIGYTEYPHLAGDDDTVAVEEGVSYTTNGTKTYLYAAADFADGGYFTVTVYAKPSLAIDLLTVYKINVQSSSTITFVEICGTKDYLTFKFKITPGCGTYYIKPEFAVEFEINRA